MKILMVCLGNICRSPMAEGILRHKISSYGLNAQVDSAGTLSLHAGEHPDRRAIKTAARHGVDISGLRARVFVHEDFERFDRIFVMDESNYENVISLAENRDSINKVDLLLNQLGEMSGKSVPDPYYGELDGFEHVFSLLNQACEQIVQDIIKSSEKK